MATNIPQFQNKELSDLVESFNESDKTFKEKFLLYNQVELEYKTAERERIAAWYKIKERTYSWTLNYELKIPHGISEDSKEGSWISPPGLSGEFIETEEDALKQLEAARDRVKKEVGKEMGLLGKRVLDYNIHFESVVYGLPPDIKIIHEKCTKYHDKKGCSR